MYTPILDKIAKLLALAEGRGANPNESAVAAATAARLMAEHRLTRDDIDAAPSENEPIRNNAGEPLYQAGQQTTWITGLASGVSRSQNCRIYLSTLRGNISGRMHRIVLVGRDSDVQVVRYLFTYLRREIERLAQAYADSGELYGRTELNNFRIGAVETVTARLLEAAKQATADYAAAKGASASTAIVRVAAEGKAVELWMKANMKLRSGGASYSRVDASAREKGREAGRSIQLSRGIGGAGTKLLGGAL